MLSKKENYRVALRGGMPEWIPSFMLDCNMFMPSCCGDVSNELYGTFFGALEAGECIDPSTLRAKSGFGVMWAFNESGPFPEPGNITIPDITCWRESAFSIPSLEGYDWDAHLEEDLALIDPEKAIQFSLDGPFVQMMNAMGVDNALVAMYEEPEAVHDFLDAVTTYLSECVTQVVKRVKCDSFTLYEDVATATGLFMSPDMYREMVKPYTQRMFAAAKAGDPDIVTEIHCCGKCEELLDDFVEVGAQAWHPAQTINDLDAVRAKFGTSLVIEGGWDNIGVYSNPDLTEEEVRQSVRDSMDRLGGMGAYIFSDVPLGISERMMEIQGWIGDEAISYGKQFYTK